MRASSSDGLDLACQDGGQITLFSQQGGASTPSHIGAAWNIYSIKSSSRAPSRSVDLYYPRQHLWDLGGLLHPTGREIQTPVGDGHQRFLDQAKFVKLVVKLRSLSSANAELAVTVRTEAHYFERNAERTRYPKFRKQKLFVGSGLSRPAAKPNGVPAQAFRHVLDCAWRQRRHPPAMLSPQSPVSTTTGNAVAADYLPLHVAHPSSISASATCATVTAHCRSGEDIIDFKRTATANAQRDLLA